MHVRTLMLSALAGGPILGSLLGLAVDTRIQPPADPPWLHRGQASIAPSQASYDIAPPEDLNPYGAPRAMMLARRFAADADMNRRPVYIPIAAQETSPPAQIADEAARAAADAALAAGPTGDEASEAGLVPASPSTEPAEAGQPATVL